jgi:hypothetical protein
MEMNDQNLNFWLLISVNGADAGSGLLIRRYFFPEFRTLYVFQNPVFTLVVNALLPFGFTCG